MWSSLPSNLRTILGCALVLGVGVTAAAFTLSFFALRSVAENPQLQFGKGHAWLYPIALDMALVFAEILLLGASMVRGQNRAIPVLLVFAFGGASVYFNLTRVPDAHGLRLIAVAPAVASIMMTLGLAYLMKMLTTLTGGVQAYHAPQPVDGYLMGREGPLRGVTYRPGYEPSVFQNSHTGHALGGNGDTKKHLVEQYLDNEVDSGDLRRITGREIAEVLSKRGVPMTAQTANGVLKDYRRAHGIPSR